MPQPEPAAINSGQASPAAGVRAPVAPPAPQPTAPAERGGRSFDFGHGSGPVGPLFLGLLLWARRVRRKSSLRPGPLSGMAAMNRRSA